MPLYRHQNKVIYFAHIPKCAGSTVEKMIAERCKQAAFLNKEFSEQKALNFAIQTPVPLSRDAEIWGDWHFAIGLAEAFKRLGHNAEVRSQENWLDRKHDDEIDIVIRGKARYSSEKERITVYWIISNTNTLKVSEFTNIDLVFVASPTLTDDLREKLKNQTSAKFHFLPQAFDKDRMYLNETQAKRSGSVFIGMARKDYARPMPAFAANSGYEFNLFGPGWQRSPLNIHLKANAIDNTKVKDQYNKHKIVLNDHMPAMMAHNILSNRTFDALACGAAVITDPIDYLPPEFEPFVIRVKNQEEFNKAINVIESENEDKQAKRIAFAAEMRETHSFDARATEMIAQINNLN